MQVASAERLLVLCALVMTGAMAQIGPVGTRPLPEPEWRLTADAVTAFNRSDGRILGAGSTEDRILQRLSDGTVVPLTRGKATVSAVLLKEAGRRLVPLQPADEGGALYLEAEGHRYPLETVDGLSRTQISGGASVAANTNGTQGAGVTYLGFQHTRRNSFLSGYLNYSPIRLLGADSMAQGMLNPGADTLSFQLAGIQFMQAGPEDDTRHGLSGRLQWSKVGFERAVTINGLQTTETLDCGLLSGFVGYRLAHGVRRGPNPMAVGMEVGLASRWLMGDAGMNSQFRRDVFGSNREIFWGPELAFYFSLNEYTPYARLTRFQGNMEGFSEWQVSIGLNVDTSIAGL